MRNIYLSIDLDYWRFIPNGNVLSLQLFKTLAELDLDALIVSSHEMLLDHINRSSCNELINLDYHSDLTEEPSQHFNDGTWVNFVDWKEQGKFIWKYPDHYDCVKLERGVCHSEAKDPFVHKLCSWKSVKREQGYSNLFKPGVLKAIKAIGITTSHSWLTSGQLRANYLPKLIGSGTSEKDIHGKLGSSFSHTLKLRIL